MRLLSFEVVVLLGDLPEGSSSSICKVVFAMRTFSREFILSSNKLLCVIIECLKYLYAIALSLILGSTLQD